MFLAVAFGIGIGVSLGMLGAGGSILAVPVLVYALGQPVRDAVPTSLWVVGGSSMAGALSHLRDGNVPLRSASMFGVAGIAGSFAGAWINHQLDPDLLLLGFALVMVLAAVAMLRKRPKPDELKTAKSCENAWRERPLMVLVVGAGVGVITGLFGVGGGFILVPAWTLAMGCPVQVSVGASLVVIVLNTAGALVSHIGFGSVDLAVAVPFTVAAIIGAGVGARFANRVDSKRLSKWFAYLVIVVAVFMVVQVLSLDAAQANP